MTSTKSVLQTDGDGQSIDEEVEDEPLLRTKLALWD